MRNLLPSLAMLATYFVSFTKAFNPLVPTDHYTYVIEAARGSNWPTCSYRFISRTDKCDATIDLWNGAGSNQNWQLISAGSDGLFYIKSTNCDKYVSYDATCSNSEVTLTSKANEGQKFRVISNNNQFQYYLEAIDRTGAGCSNKYLSFPNACTTNSADHLVFTDTKNSNGLFQFYPITSTNPTIHSSGSSFVCPDPFVWQPRQATDYFHIACTGGGIQLGTSQGSDLEADKSVFNYKGDLLGGDISHSWASIDDADSRWAPENYESPDSKYNYLFFSDSQANDNDKHRIGWAASTAGVNISAYTNYSPSYLNLGMAAGGDIDGTIFEDNDGKTYLIWKTDDNSVGSVTTRIWLQELAFNGLSVKQVNSPVVLMDSTGLWWVDSWVQGGTLVEGPEMVHYNGYYYLFFASGRFCQDSYQEGVARSKSLLGPYEKMQVPLLSNGIVGHAKNKQGQVLPLVGPGHASILPLKTSSSNIDWRIVWHASIGENCDRYSFISELMFGEDGWPYVNF